MDYVYYKLPFETTIQFKKGVFNELENKEKSLSGFVISDFLHKKVYNLQEEDSMNEQEILHFSSEKPIVISHRDYLIEAQSAIHAFGLMGVEKMVYSKVKMQIFDHSKTMELFNLLCENYPTVFCYLISSAKFGTWIGATPELLAQKRGLQIKTVALASTKKLNDNSDWNSKELNEHRFVVENIRSTCEKYALEELEIDGPKSHPAGPVKHLLTEFSGHLTKNNFWNFLNDLHPTPAVCGTPRIQALDLLLSREMHERELYTGFIGLNNELNADIFVNLRCAQIQEGRAFLYLGGGFTKDSNPENEWEETENKAETLLKFMRELV